MLQLHAPGTTGPAGAANPGGSTSPGPAPAPAVPPPPAEPVSLFMAFCPEQPNGPRPNTPLPIPTPCQRVGIVTRDAGTGVQRTLSPTAYRPEQTSGITSIWARQTAGKYDCLVQFGSTVLHCASIGDAARTSGLLVNLHLHCRNSLKICFLPFG